MAPGGVITGHAEPPHRSAPRAGGPVVRALLRVAVLASVAVLAAGCASTQSRGHVSFGRATVLIATDHGTVLVHAQVADTPQRRKVGLQGRRSLPPDAGMVFLFFRPTHESFWMKDTEVPLSIAFFGEDGRILALRNMAPCRAQPCPTYNPGVAYRGALEVNRGAFRRWGVRVGDRITVAH